MSRVNRKTTKGAAKAAKAAAAAEPTTHGSKAPRKDGKRNAQNGVDKGAAKKTQPAGEVAEERPESGPSSGPFISRPVARALVQSADAVAALGSLTSRRHSANDAADVAYHDAAIALGFIGGVDRAISSGKLAGLKLAERTLADRYFFQDGVAALRVSTVDVRSPAALARYVSNRWAQLQKAIDEVRARPWAPPLLEAATLRLADDVASAVGMLQRQFAAPAPPSPGILPFPQTEIPPEIRDPQASTALEEAQFLGGRIAALERWLLEARGLLARNDANRDLSRLSGVVCKGDVLHWGDGSRKKSLRLDVAPDGGLYLALGKGDDLTRLRGGKDLVELVVVNNPRGIEVAPVICELLDALAPHFFATAFQADRLEPSGARQPPRPAPDDSVDDSRPVGAAKKRARKAGGAPI